MATEGEMAGAKSIFAHQLRGSLIALLISVVAIGGVIYQVANRSLMESVENSLRYHADFRKERIITLFRQQQAWMKNIAQSEGIQHSSESLFDLYQQGVDGEAYLRASRGFRQDYSLLLSAQGVEDLFLVTPQAELAFSLRPMNEELGVDLSQEGFYGATILSGLIEAVLQKRHLVISKYGRIEQLEEATVLMGVPIFSSFPGQEREMVGILVRPFSLEWLRNLLESYSGLGETGEVLVAQWRDEEKSQVNFINHFRNHLRREPDSRCQQQRMNEPERFPIMHALKHESGSGWMLDNSCRPVYALWDWIPELELAMVVKQDRSEVMLPVNELGRNILLAGLLVLLFLVWIIHRQAKILVRPIVELKEAAQSGAFEQRKDLSVQEVNELAHTLRRRSEHLERARRETELILESMDEGLVVINHSGNIERVNPKLIKLMGRPMEQIVGRSADILFDHTEQGFEGRRLLRCCNGLKIPVTVARARLECEPGKVGGEVLVVHDLRALIKAERAEEANKAKDDFLASVSHELRTPLTAIIANSEMLMSNGFSRFSAQQRAMVRSIEIAGRIQLALVNDILDLSKIEAGKFVIDRSAFDLNHLLHELEHIFSHRAENSGLQFEIRETLGLSHLIEGDMRRIGQILINLLSNAIKFTEVGRVTLTVTLDSAAEWLCFSVEDQGIGISESAIERLFMPFEQADHSISSRFGGTGLGLYISRTLAEKMGGEITVRSTLGEGTVFDLCIPFQQSSQPRSAEFAEEQQALTALRFQGSLLLAEDTPELQNITRFMLESMGIEVALANNGEEAVKLALQRPYDLILMDMRMPVMDGIEATQRLRSAGYRHPIIANTADVVKKHLDSFMQAGCDGLLSKPIEQAELRRILKRYLPLQQPEAPVVVESPMAAVLASAEFEISDELKQVFFSRLGELRGTLQEARDAGNWEQLHDAAHAIKGSGKMYGYAALSELAQVVCDVVDQQRHDEIDRHLEPLLAEVASVLH